MKTSTIQAGALSGALSLALAASALWSAPAPVMAAEATEPKPAVLVVKDSHNAMADVAPPKIPAFGKVAVKPGMVRGIVKDVAGKPLKGATIVVQSSALGGLRTSVTTKTNAQGLYEIQPPVGICQVVNADYRVRYNNKGYLLPLRAADGERDDFNSREGHVENFVLQTWGVANRDLAEQSPQYGEYYYGAHIRLQWLDIMPEEGTIEVTLTPQGPLMDGSQGRTFLFRLPTEGRSERFLNNIPIGRYTMQARMLEGGDSQPLQLEKLRSETSKPALSLTIDFEPAHAVLASLESSGITQYEVIVKR